eukprot:8985574-Alexandrium_andersonii.AAC.1
MSAHQVSHAVTHSAPSCPTPLHDMPTCRTAIWTTPMKHGQLVQKRRRTRAKDRTAHIMLNTSMLAETHATRTDAV